MSNTKQQITKMLEDYHQPYCNAITYRLGCICGLRENIQAIDRLVTEARIEELKQLEPPEQYEEYARLMGSEHCRICGFNAIEFRKYISKEIAELQSQLTNKQQKKTD